MMKMSYQQKKKNLLPNKNNNSAEPIKHRVYLLKNGISFLALFIARNVCEIGLSGCFLTPGTLPHQIFPRNHIRRVSRTDTDSD